MMNMARQKRDQKTVALAQEIIKQFNPQTAQDADEALKELFGPIFEGLLQGEMEHHLGYKSNDKGFKRTENRRNGYGNKKIHTTKGDISIDVPRDRDASFEPKLIQKKQKDVSGLEDKVLAMYAGERCHREIFLKQYKISMDLKSLMKWYLKLQILYYLNYRNGKTEPFKSVMHFYS